MSRVAPTYVVEVRTIVCPGRACATAAVHAALSAPRSGTSRRSTGVGTQMITASAAAAAAGSAVTVSASPAARSRSWSLCSRSTRPLRMSSRRPVSRSTPRTRRPRAWNASAVGRPT
nr:hypothetical protein [Actinomadura sp. CNU-125]